MRVAAVVSDLMLYSRIESAASAAGASLVRVDDPADLPHDLDLVVVDWSARRSSWRDLLLALQARGARVVLFGPHVDLDAHADARAAGLGPMWARSKLVVTLPELLVRSWAAPDRTSAGGSVREELMNSSRPRLDNPGSSTDSSEDVG